MGLIFPKLLEVKIITQFRKHRFFVKSKTSYLETFWLQCLCKRQRRSQRLCRQGKVDQISDSTYHIQETSDLLSGKSNCVILINIFFQSSLLHKWPMLSKTFNIDITSSILPQPQFGMKNRIG